MKALPIALALLVSILTTAFAQTEKGRWAAGGQGSFSYSSQQNTHDFSMTLSPSVGYIVADNFLIGSGITLSYNDAANNINSYKYSSLGLGLSPFVRYYFGKTNWRPFAGLAGTYSFSHQQGTVQGSSFNSPNSYVYKVSPTLGLAYFINRTASVNFGLAYNRFWYSNVGTYVDGNGNRVAYSTSAFNSVTLDVGFQLFFGK